MARDSPYQGLDPFGEQDASFFFGRERDIKLISANTLAATSLLVYGPSGVGKTSVLLAGVVPGLRERASVLVAVCREWSGDPVARLTEAVTEAARAVGRDVPVNDAGFAALLEQCATGLGRRVVLVFDQFEDRLAAVVGPDPFVEELADALATADLPLSVLIAVREESLARLDRLEGYVPGLFETVYRLDHLDRAAGEVAIRGPLDAWNADVEPDGAVTVADALVAAVLAEIPSAEDPSRIETAHLQLVMQRVWDAERDHDSRVLRAQTFADLGGAREIVREHVTGALDALDAYERALASDILDRLVTPSGIRMAQSPTDLAVLASAALDDVQALLERLSGARVLRPVSRPEGGEAFEVFHPSLADAALAWRTRYVAEQRAARERARAQRWLMIAVALALVLALVAGLGTYAWVQRQTARAQAYTAGAGEQLEIDPALALALALEGVQRRRTDRSVNALRRALQASDERAVLAGHEGPVSSVSIGTDGVLTAGEDGTVRLWDPVTGEQLRSYPSRKDEVLDATFCPDAGRIAVAAGDGAFLLVGDEEIALDQRGAAAEAVSCTPDGALIATAGDDGVARIFERDGTPYRTLGGGDRLVDAALSRDGTLLAAASETGNVTIWAVETGKRRAVFRVGLAPSVAFAPDGSRLVTGDSSGRVAFVGSKSPVAQPLESHLALVTGVAYSPDGALAASASAGDEVVRVWNTWSGEEIASLRGHDGKVTDIAFGSDGRTIATAGEDGTARVWQLPVTVVLRGHSGPVRAVASDRAGTSIVTAGRNAGGGESVRIWSIANGDELARFATPGGEAASVSASGTHVLAVGPGSSLRTWEVGRPAKKPVSLTGALTAAFSPNGNTIAVGGFDGVRLVGVDGGRPQRLPVPGPVTPIRAVAFSPDGKRLAVATYPKGEITILDIASGSAPVPMRGSHEGARSLAFSADGARLVSAGTDNSPHVWDTATGRLIVAFRGSGERVRRVSFDPSGSIVLTSDQGERIRLRDAATGRELSSFPGIDAAFVPTADETLIVIAGQRGNAYLLRCDLCGSRSELRDRARGRITRSTAERDGALR